MLGIAGLTAFAVFVVGIFLMRFDAPPSEIGMTGLVLFWAGIVGATGVFGIWAYQGFPT